ncbi:DNA polymerase IV [Tepidibacillus fermentans]|uniref:DNA polymerase IV n=1 Tax=Tepidibacillus fermentans TaxID=1281767 RepID=A0A4R3KN58_9BACI|nr:DNA polymerase IV [Tepidibacillus fermentans]TCS84458.1 DNA polymerase-4 [Tepidibacillus fermentans]
MKAKKKVIFLVDMQSFYASVEIASDPTLMGKPVAVVGDPAKRHGITLAANPEAKAAGVKTAMPVWQVRSVCPNVEFVKPHMQKYIDTSIQITHILEQFTDQVEVYSIDEQFLDVTASQSLFGPPLQMAKMIQERIWKEVGVRARIGIGENKIQAKMACDNFAKKNKEGIFELNRQNYRKYTSPLAINQLFGVGSRMKRNFERIGIYTIGDLANRSLEEMKRRWGIMGHVLWLSAQGIDYSPVERNSTEVQKGIGNSITLPRDYYIQEEIETVLLEITEEVCRRARSMHQKGRTVHVSLRGADFDRPTGFHRQTTLPEATNNTMEIYQAVLQLFHRFWDRKPVRSIGINITQLEDDRQVQLSLFADPIKKLRLGQVMDEIRERYGRTAIFRASSLLSAGLLFDRASKIGGHEA